MPDHLAPDYPLDDHMALDRPEQFRALFDETRLDIVELLSERAATTSQLADALGRPKGTIGHHLGVLADAGLIHIVRTEKVRALEAKYFGRRARTFDFSRAGMAEAGVAPESILTAAAREFAAAESHFAGRDLPGIMSVRHARIPSERAAEFARRLERLLRDFASSPREGDTVFGLAVALYPTDRPHLGGTEDER